MRTIALNGFLYSIDKWLSPNVETPYSFNWTESKADKLSRSINEPTTIIGFSDGATAALRIACTNPNIRRAYIHSPMPYEGGISSSPPFMIFFRTEGDTTPTFNGASFNYRKISNNSPYTVNVLANLPFVDFTSPNFIESWVLKPKRHIFHNCLNYLPREIKSEL